jgi:hypothetical protein
MDSWPQTDLRASPLAIRILLLAALLSMHALIGHAQQASRYLSREDEEPIVEQVTDPLAHLTQIQIKDIYTPAEYGTNAQTNTIQLRPVLAIHPFFLIPFEELLWPTIRIVTIPNGKGASTATTYDDMQLFDLFQMPWPHTQEIGFRWGLGPYFVFPTSASDRVGKGSWQMGPAWAFSYRGIPHLNIAALFQQSTSSAYTSSRSKSSASLTFQPIVNYQLGNGWYLKSSDATWVINLRHKSSTTIPLSAGIGRVWKLSRDFAFSTSVGVEENVYRQFADQTEQFTIDFSVRLLFPD